MTDFHRINQPRIDKIGATIATIRKSARSQKISDEDVAELLAPVAASVGAQSAESVSPAVTPAQVETAPQPRPTTPLREAPHIHQIAGFVASLPREQLPSYITHLVNRLCEEATA